ncbi:conserved hypothetical protein [Pyrobaculum neutrophilum V24Sta]|uniref:Uncharacterized protein n=2 Tax=Pyrobaculum neutrophilum TaxID=70771 RepID=B1YD76_PYRNV|nr:conserved hypothetical protein [Pyrobaculum neutrophilum V24Sta]
MALMVRRRNYRPLAAVAVLAVAALVAATVTFTNVTYWLINATKPPAMKYPGADTAVAGGQYVKVSYYYDSQRGVNITRISIIGFTGDPTNYTSVVKVCNYYGTTPITAYLVWVGQVGTTGYEGYIKAFLVKGPDGKGVGFVGTTTYTQAGPYTINPGACIDIGAYVAIDPAIPLSLANGQTILGTYQVNIQMSPQ